MRVRPAALLLAAALSLAAVPEGTPGYALGDPDRDVYFLEEQAWFTASSPTGIGNVDHENGAFMGWSDAEPTSPVGGVTVATATSGFQSIVDDGAHDRGQFTAEGTFTGYLDTMTLDLYYVSPVADFCGLSVAVDLEVDGIPVLDMDGISGRIDVASTPGENGTLVQLKVTNIFAQLDSFGSSGYDFVGDETTEHAISLSVQQYPLCNEVIWRYDSTDFPASVTFNRNPSDPSVSGHTTFDVTDPPAPAA